MPDSPLKDKNYNLVAALHATPEYAFQLETYASDAEGEGDQELAQFFRDQQQATQQAGDRAKALLAQRLES